MRNLRVWYGPLPEVVCIAQIKMTQAVLTFAIVAVVMIIITRFVFICVWKSMRSMDDNLLKRIALNEIILLVFLHSWCWPQSNSPSSEVCTYFCKVHIFWEGHKFFWNLHLTFDWHYIGQKWGEDFETFCGLLRIYKL